MLVVLMAILFDYTTNPPNDIMLEEPSRRTWMYIILKFRLAKVGRLFSSTGCQIPATLCISTIRSRSSSFTVGTRLHPCEHGSTQFRFPAVSKIALRLPSTKYPPKSPQVFSLLSYLEEFFRTMKEITR